MLPVKLLGLRSNLIIDIKRASLTFQEIQYMFMLLFLGKNNRNLITHLTELQLDKGYNT